MNNIHIIISSLLCIYLIVRAWRQYNRIEELEFDKLELQETLRHVHVYACNKCRDVIERVTSLPLDDD